MRQCRRCGRVVPAAADTRRGRLAGTRSPPATPQPAAGWRPMRPVPERSTGLIRRPRQPSGMSLAMPVWSRS